MGLITATAATAVRTHMPSRRLVLRAAFTVGVIAGTAGALAPVVARSPQVVKSAGPVPERFAEMYRGRSIQAVLGGIAVRIDGRPLHVMRRADGSYLSAVNHYESFPTLLEAARAAVDELGSAQLSMLSPHSL